MIGTPANTQPTKIVPHILRVRSTALFPSKNCPVHLGMQLQIPRLLIELGLHVIYMPFKMLSPHAFSQKQAELGDILGQLTVANFALLVSTLFDTLFIYRRR